MTADSGNPAHSRLQAPTGFFSEPDIAGLPGATAFFNSWRFRMRRASFCFRTRLNRDLSPLTPDIIDSCRSNRSGNDDA